MSQDKIALLRQSLAAAESSLKTAKQLLSEIESGGLKPSAKDLPGVTGTFDGTNMIDEKGETFPVPENYASKSLLVVGDTLKLVDEDGEKRFKQIEHVKRLKTTGILHKKDGKFKVITPEGSYTVLQASVDHFKGEVGDEVVLQLPAGNLTTQWGAVESMYKPGQAPKQETEVRQQETEVKPKTEAVQPKPAPKPEPKPAPKPAPKPTFKPKPKGGKPKGRPAPAPEKKEDPKPALTTEPVVIGDDDLR